MLDFLFPTYCVNCGSIGNYLCPLCIKKLKSTLPECYVCRKLSSGYTTHENCNKEDLDKVFVGWEYGNISKKILSQYKYRYAYKLSAILSSLLITRLEITGFAKNITSQTLLIPIPLHSSHEKERGFNQSSLLATNISNYYKCRIDSNILKRIGGDKHQSQQSLRDRGYLEKDVKELKELIAKEDFDEEEVEKKTEELTKKMQEVSKKMYEAAAKEASEEKEDEKKDEEDDKKEVKEGEVVDED